MEMRKGEPASEKLKNSTHEPRPLQSTMAAEEQNEEEALATENTRTRRTKAISAHKFNEKQVYGPSRIIKVVPRLDLEMDAGRVRPPSCGSWWLDTAVDYCQSSGLDVAQHGGTPQNYRDGEIVFLPKTGKNLRDARNGWRTINLLDHLGKACSRGLLQPHMPEMRKWCGSRQSLILYICSSS